MASVISHSSSEIQAANDDPIVVAKIETEIHKSSSDVPEISEIIELLDDDDAPVENPDPSEISSKLGHSSSNIPASDVLQSHTEDSAREPEPSNSVHFRNGRAEKSSNGNSDIENLSKLILEELKYMETDPVTLKNYGDAVKDQLDNAIDDLNKLRNLLNDVPQDSTDDEHQKLREELLKQFRELKKRVTKLKAKFPSKVKIHKLEKESHGKNKGEMKDSQIDNLVAEKKKQLFNLHKNSIFEQSEIFQDFKSLYCGIESIEKKLCLLGFSVFPEDAEIRKRIMIYWWISEGFISEKREGVEFLKDFTIKGFLIPTFKKPGSEPHSYKMHPLARAVLISLADEVKFFDFKDGYPTENYRKSLRSCLVGEGISDSSNLKKIHMIFNVNESIVEFRPEWFKKMENVNILHLGRWQGEEKHHIEIEDPEILDNLQYLKFLKFFSLQGVSKVTELPDSIKKLGNLRILDIRACHNLEVIPAGIGSLKNLTHLDMSECYLIEHMPKEISNLHNLIVLKGFIIVGDSKEKHMRNKCTVKDLAKLENLKKLSIYTSVVTIPYEDLKALNKLKDLQTLSISWGSASKDKSKDKTQKSSQANTADPEAKPAKEVVSEKSNINEQESFHASGDVTMSVESEKKNQENKGRAPKAEDTKTTVMAKGALNRTKTFIDKITGGQAMGERSELRLPVSLKKLELNCYPEIQCPEWLKGETLPNLEKLYIRGGKLGDVGGGYDWNGKLRPTFTKNTWSVKILRLKYLAFMAMSWRDFKCLFPQLVFLEQVNCPKLTLFPCDGSGVWIDKSKQHEAN